MYLGKLAARRYGLKKTWLWDRGSRLEAQAIVTVATTAGHLSMRAISTWDQLIPSDIALADSADNTACVGSSYPLAGPLESCRQSAFDDAQKASDLELRGWSPPKQSRTACPAVAVGSSAIPPNQEHRHPSKDIESPELSTSLAHPEVFWKLNFFNHSPTRSNQKRHSTPHHPTVPCRYHVTITPSCQPRRSSKL